MTTTLITSYLSEGLASARPSSPAVATGCIAFYYATDTGAVTVYDGSVWHAVGGGYSAGSPPTVVQSGSDQAGNKGITLGSAPVNGNLLIAMSWNTPSPSAGSGWTQLFQNGSGTDYGTIFYKVAGAGESTTQNVLTANETPGCMVIWEINGQAATWLVQAIGEGEQSSATYAFSPTMGPLDQKLLFLGGIGLVSTSYSFSKMYGCTQDVFLNTGSTRQLAAGHATIDKYPTAQIAALVGGASSYKGLGLIITS
jgi:hypothetical protein